MYSYVRFRVDIIMFIYVEWSTRANIVFEFRELFRNTYRHLILNAQYKYIYIYYFNW